MFKTPHRFALSALSIATVINSAWAQTSSCTPPAGFSLEMWYMENPQCKTEGPEAAKTSSSATIQGTSVNQAVTISNIVSSAISGQDFGGLNLAQHSQGFRGIAAGSPAKSWNFWSNYSYNELAYTREIRKYDSKINNLILGGDYRITPQWTTGISYAHDEGNINTRFDSGVLDSTGHALAIYTGYQISPTLTADASMGYGAGKVHQRISSIGSGETDTTRNFAAVNLSSTHWLGKLNLVGKLNLISADEKRGDYQFNSNSGGGQTRIEARNAHLTQARLGLQAGYWMGGWMPYAGLLYSNDLNRTSETGVPHDADAWILSLGLNLFNKRGVSGGILYTSELDRKDAKNSLFQLNLNVRF